MIYVGQSKTDRFGSFHKSINFLVKIANCLGLLPVTGLATEFKWRSWKCLYTFTIMAIFVTNSVICIINWTFVKFSLKLLGTQMNVINALTSLVLYVKLAKKWPKLVKVWSEVDRKMNQVYGYPKNLDQRIVVATCAIFVAAIGEYILLMAYHILMSTINGRQFDIEYFYLSVFPEFFSVVDFNGYTAFIANIATMIGHMIWSFNDLFIIVISSALALRFKQITDRLYLDQKKPNSNNYWIQIRADYDRLVYLSKKVDKYISAIVLLSYAANIFFLLVQLSNVIGHLNYNIQVFYYTYSFSFLIARLAIVSLYGAWVSEESREPAFCLQSLPSATYNLEIRRLLLQISFNDVAITGSKMFKISRSLLLHVAGAIVTYELVIIQFNNAEELQ